MQAIRSSRGRPQPLGTAGLAGDPGVALCESVCWLCLVGRGETDTLLSRMKQKTVEASLGDQEVGGGAPRMERSRISGVRRGLSRDRAV